MIVEPGNLWRSWEFDPGVVIPLAASAVLYLLGSRKEALFHNRQRTFFWLGLGALVLALVSPLHRLGEVLFSAHMVQHEILMLVAAPLLVLSRPLVTFLWALSRRTMGENSVRSRSLEHPDRPVYSVVAACGRDLGLACTHPVRSDT
jgi:cytochrome c oxidase assembly factor CtaG